MTKLVDGRTLQQAKEPIDSPKDFLELKKCVDERFKGTMGTPSDEPPVKTRVRQDLDAMKSSL